MVKIDSSQRKVGSRWNDKPKVRFFQPKYGKIIRAYRITTLLLILAAASPTAMADESYQNKNVADILGWVSDPNANLCRGYFSEPQELLKNPIPPPITQAPTHISYAGPGTISTYGKSVISKEVVITQPGRIVKADKAIIYRDPKTGKIDYIRLEGHVQVREKGKLVAGPYSVIHFDQHTVELGPAAYHLYEDPQHFHLPTAPRPYDAWGTADKTFRDADGKIYLTNATYTTCAPTDPSWQITAGRIILDQKSGFGTAYNSTLKFYNIPVVYAPIYSFPIDSRRKTGFLTPDISYQDNNGVGIGLPYYWNLAPNYDLTTTPKYIQNRGFQLNSLFRYMAEPGNQGSVYLSVAPNDTTFGDFRSDTLANPPTPPSGTSEATLTPYLNDLNGYSDFRGFLHLQNSSQFNQNWASHIELNYVTDDYYFQDFGSAYSDIVANQLPNQADLSYHDDNVSFVGLIQGYQTLHIIGQASNPAVDQYTRLPELDFSSDYANVWQGTDFSLGAQSVNFAYNSQFEPTTFEQPVGERLHLRPTLTRPFYGSAGYITPQVALDSTSYAAGLATLPNNDDPNDNPPPTTTQIDSRPQFDASRNLPIVDVDSGLYFDRPIHWDNHSYLATMEPRLFYLYVPYMNQDKYPNFDSELLPFTFPQLFDVNRFTSFDRMENANQFSFGLTSRVLNSNTSDQKFKMDIGFGYYLQSPKVCLDPTDCTTTTYNYISPTSHVTPLVGQLTYYPWTDWAVTGSYAYDTNLGVTNNAEVGFDYDHNETYVFTADYTYVREQNGDPIDNFGFSNSTNLINSGFAWPFTEHWSGLAYAQYNLSKQRPDSYYGGLQYESCCWIFRVIAERSFFNYDTSSDGSRINVFKNSYYVQLQLKSLGNIGTSASGLLSSTLSNFADPFK